MIGSAVQLGLLAALIVILVPIMLAGWHLSRHKLLFFSGALFVALAVAVHLSPYFPSLPDYLPNSKITPLIENRDSCLDLMNRIEWDVYGGDVGKSRVLSWRWDHDVGNCGFQRLKRGNVGELLNGSWVVVAGDSQARLFAVSLLGLVLGEAEMGAVRGDLFKRHSDYGIVVDGVGMRLDFIWAPYEGNLTEVVAELTRNGSCPDVLVMGSGLWHMLHVTNSVDYGVSLGALSDSVMSLLVPGSPDAVDGGGSGAVCARSQPHLFWLGMPMLINSMLNTEEKREKMSNVTRDAYDWRVRQSKLLRQSNGPFLLLDVRDLSKNCGVHCTEDGMHYYGIIYEAAVQIMLNALLIQSRQKL
ncbi:hypothetical protein Droror1_Dr00002085 [Drosera rotundifolia]